MATPTKTTRTTTTKRPPGTTTNGASATAAAPKQKSLEQHLSTLAEGEVLDPQGLYEFCESLRALATGMSFYVHAAASQLDRAARKGARDNADGRLTMAQRAEMMIVIKRLARRLDNGAAEDLLAAGSNAVKAYGLLEDFLEKIESDTVDRPHRGSRGGFTLNRS